MRLLRVSLGCVGADFISEVLFGVFSGWSDAMPFFFHVVTSCQLRCQRVGHLKRSVFSWCLMVLVCCLGGFSIGLPVLPGFVFFVFNLSNAKTLNLTAVHFCFLFLIYF